jgi:hypothetical protein
LAQTALQQAASEHPPLECVEVHEPLAAAPQRPVQSLSASAAHEVSHVMEQHSGIVAHTVEQHSLSEHPAAAWASRQLSGVPPQVCARAVPARSRAATVARLARIVFMMGSAIRSG